MCSLGNAKKQNDGAGKIIAPLPAAAMRKLAHLDLLGSKEDCRKNLMEFSGRLDGDNPRKEIKNSLTLTNEHEFIAKFSEMMGHKLSFQITHKSPRHRAADSVLIAKELVPRLNLEMRQEDEFWVVDIPNRATIKFDERGTISASTNPHLFGRDCLQFIACNVHEDFGVVMLNDGKLEYDFDSAMFEKSPKDAVTGENKFIGRDFVGFHSQGKNFGHMLPEIFGKLVKAFSDGRLETLTIDLRGAHIFGNGRIDVRRFERDFVVPIMKPLFRGMLVFTDVFFQDVNEKKSPFDGGSGIEIRDPVGFSSEFRVKK